MTRRSHRSDRRADFCSAVVSTRRSTPPASLFTLPFSINNRGQIVGSTASDPAGTELHGFLLARGVEGPFTPIDFPGAPSTVAFDINDRGQIVGVYENPDAAPDHRASPCGCR